MKEDNKTSNNQRLTPVSGESNRPSNHSEFESEKTPEACGNTPAKGSDSPLIQGSPSLVAAGAPVNSKPTKLTRQQLVSIEARLTARDHAVLQAIRKYRFLTTDQIGRLYVTDCSTKTSQTRHQNLLFINEALLFYA